MVVPVLTAVDETGGFGPVDEADCAVVAEQEMLGDITDRGTSRVACSSLQCRNRRNPVRNSSRSW